MERDEAAKKKSLMENSSEQKQKVPYFLILKQVGVKLFKDF